VPSDHPRKARKRPEEFNKFEDLTRRLLRVRKPELDEAVKQDKERRRQQG
jgi:hypothetical protein